MKIEDEGKDDEDEDTPEVLSFSEDSVSEVLSLQTKKMKILLKYLV